MEGGRCYKKERCSRLGEVPSDLNMCMTVRMPFIIFVGFRWGTLKSLDLETTCSEEGGLPDYLIWTSFLCHVRYI